MKRALKWFARTLVGLVALVLLAGFAMYHLGGKKLSRTFQVQTTPLEILRDSASIARGEYLSFTSGCHECHGADLSGTVMADELPFRFVASNLTSGRGGVGGRFTTEDFERAIRHGVRPDGSFMMIMPSKGLHQMSDRDVAALIAYLQQLPPVDNELPQSEFHALGRIIAAIFPDDELYLEVGTGPARKDAPEPAPTAEYGAYLASGVCAYCHGDNLEGDETPPGPPEMIPAPSLVPAGQWTIAEFAQALRTGVSPGGRALNPEFMPIAFTKHMDDVDVAAIHAHLATLVPTPSGS